MLQAMGPKGAIAVVPALASNPREPFLLMMSWTPSWRVIKKHRGHRRKMLLLRKSLKNVCGLMVFGFTTAAAISRRCQFQ